MTRAGYGLCGFHDSVRARQACRKGYHAFPPQGFTTDREGQQGFKDGTFAATMQSILAEVKPEAVYLTAAGGERTAYVIVDLQDASQLPSVAEPFFLAFEANIEVHPAMLPEDLMKASPAIEQAVKKYA